MPVSSTETAVDRMRQAKELGDAIAVLKSAYERAENDTKMSVKAAETAAVRLHTLENEIAAFPAIIEEATKETTAFLARCADAVRAAAQSMEKSVENYLLIVAECEKTGEKMTSIKEMARVVHESTLREIEGMENMRRDLSIYEARVQKAVEEHLPGHKFQI